jgi:dimethylhistidine N-methyltransferase
VRSSNKTRHLIDALRARRAVASFTPIDISRSALEKSAEALRRAYPGLVVADDKVGDYQRDLGALLGTAATAAAESATFVLFLGSTLGNLQPAEARDLLRSLRASLKAGDALLLGVDLKKDEAVLVPAYDDPLGVTASFNLNLLGRINRELGGEFDLSGFAHRAVYNRELGRIEMHIVSRRAQAVRIAALGLTVEFTAGEAILSECSYKFSVDDVRRLAAETGFRHHRTWQDAAGLFASNLLLAA